MDERVSIGEESEIDLSRLSRVAWRYKYLVMLVVLGCTAAAVFYALTAKPIYRAEVVITEVREGGMGAGTSIANQLGGLASMAGISLGTGNGGRSGQAILKSRHLVEEFVNDNQLLPVLFPTPKQRPTLWLAVKRFQEGILRITDDVRADKTTVAIEWTDPTTAAKWANGFVALANERIRARALEESSRNVSYLKDQIAKTNVVELQRVMYNLIESETKTLMLANARAEYAFTVVDPAVPPEIRTSPRRTLIVLVGIAGGLFAGLSVGFMLDMWRSGRKEAP